MTPDFRPAVCLWKALFRLASLLLLAAIAMPAFATQRALVMTIANYPGAPLPGVVHDQDNALKLLDRLGYARAQTRVLSDAALTLDGLRKALRQLISESQAEDQVFVYFSGHGTHFVANNSCQQALLTHDLQPFGSSEFASLLGELGQGVAQLDVLLDSCFAGGVSGAARRSLAEHHVRVKFLDTALPTAACPDPVNFLTGNTLRSVARPKSAINLDNNFVYLAAARADEVAFDDEDKGGVATTALLDCIQGGGNEAESGGSFGSWTRCAQTRMDSASAQDPELHGQHLVLTGNSELKVHSNALTAPAARAATATANPSDTALNGVSLKGPQPALGKPGRRVALVIGNSDYPHAKLANPVHDAQDMAARLRELGFEVIEKENISSRQVGSVVAEFRRHLAGAETGLFFYAGHGVQVRGENYLPTVDEGIETEDDVPNQSLAVRQVLEAIEESHVPLGLLFLDACRDNPFARSTRSGTRGLSKVDAPAGVLMSFATRPGSVAADGFGRNGLYTAQLLAEIGRSGNQPIELMLKRVVAGVRQASQGRQDPWIEGSLSGDFCFSGCQPSNPATAGSTTVSTGPVASIAPSLPAAMAVAAVAPLPTKKIATEPAAERKALAAGASEKPSATLAREASGVALQVSSTVSDKLLFVHGQAPGINGRVYKLTGGRSSALFERTAEGNHGIRSAVTARNGDLYFCDGTETRIYRLHDGQLSLALQHDGYIHHLAMDSADRLHFSSSKSPRGDGAIYRMESNGRKLILEVASGAMDGWWSGDFAFDARDKIWLSTGDHTPSALYRMESGQPVKVYESPELHIMGFAFLHDGSIAFADNRHAAQQLKLPNSVSQIFVSPFNGRLTDIQRAETLP